MHKSPAISSSRVSRVLLTGLLSLPMPAVLAADVPVQTHARSGGATTVNQADHNAYSLPLANLDMMRRLDFSVGNSFFRNPWVIAPSSTDARDGLGPLFNANACQNCHIKDGRGQVPHGDEPAVSLFLRLSRPTPANPDEQTRQILRTHGVIPDPVYGGQLQNFAIPGATPEGQMQVSYTEHNVALADGTQVALRTPEYRIVSPGYGALADDLLISPRLAPPMIGLGLLEAIPDADILALADPDDHNGDGISGRPNRVWDVVRQKTVLGRFGWKAGKPDVRQQSSGAFAGDMGLTTPLHPHTDCTPSQACDRFPHGGEPEVSEKIENFVHFYATSLAVPARRDMDQTAVQSGAQVFNALGCASCHTPRQMTGEVDGRPDLSRQEIWPYTDLLLHDMGDGLADHRPEFEATGREWRTPALWGIGLTQRVNPKATFLHDGRARTLLEAILWHGGEAQAARDKVTQLSTREREALLAFLNSL